VLTDIVCCRNINWSSPETLTRDTANINEAADVWSLGMVIFEVLSGEVPFDNDEYRSMGLAKFLESLRENCRPTLPRDLQHLTWLQNMVYTQSHFRCF
jgi:serine/threonine protein kinase